MDVREYLSDKEWFKIRTGIGKIEVHIDHVANKIDEVADLCEFWKKNRDKGRTPNSIRKAILLTLNEIMMLDQIDNVTFERIPCSKCDLTANKFVLVDKLGRGARCIGCGKEVPFPTPDPELIQGFTAKQWQEIIDGGYVVEFPDGNGYWCQCRLKEIDSANSLFVCIHDYEYKDCRPANIKGVMRPIFVEPVDRDAACHFYDQKGRAIAKHRIRCQSKPSRATKYIEV